MTENNNNGFVKTFHFRHISIKYNESPNYRVHS